MWISFFINGDPGFAQLSRGGEYDFKGCEYEDDTTLALTDITSLIFALLSNGFSLLIHEISTWELILQEFDSKENTC